MTLIKQPILPGFAAGDYESRPAYNRAEFDTHSACRDPARRGNHINIRLSTVHLEQLYKLALQEGLPVQSLIASIVHRYLEGELVAGVSEPQDGAGTDLSRHQTPPSIPCP